MQFESILVVTKLLAHYSWEDIKFVLEDYFQFRIAINPFMDDKAMIKCDGGFSSFTFPGKWRNYSDLHFKLEHWSEKFHSHQEVIRSYGGWPSIKNLPLRYWRSAVFEAIGKNLGGLLDISSSTLNCLDRSSAVIHVGNNIC